MESHKPKRPNPDGSSDDEIDDDSNEEANQLHVKMPKKSKHRMRAHINPLNRVNYPFPISPDHVNWKLHFPLFYNGTKEED